MQSYRAVNGSSMLYQNSIKSLVVHGLIKKNDGKENPLVVSRTTYADLTTHFTETGGKPNTHYSHEIPSTGPVPDLPPDGDIKLHLELGEMLHQGDDNHTTVYRVEPSSSHPSATASTYYPPMVIKVAPEREGRRLAEESALYARFRCLQGSVIPRCYGYFRERVDLLHNVVMPWSPDCEFPRDDLDIFQLPNSNASLNFLLLEYVGIPVKAPQAREDLRRDLPDMVDELSHYGLQHNDLHDRNVRWVDEQEGCIPGLPSPRHGRIFDFRIIDLDRACVTNLKYKFLCDDQKEEIKEIIG